MLRATGGLLAGATILAGHTTAQDERPLTIQQGNSCSEVTPLNTGQTVEEFYDYDNVGVHSNTGLEKSDVSNLFLFDGPKGRSLVVIHDKPDDGTGGAASLDFTGLPAGAGQWVIRDDPGEFDSSTDKSPNWSWANGGADGGAWRGGLDSGLGITVDPAFNDAAAREPPAGNEGKINEWHFLSGDASSPNRILLDLEESVLIRSGTC